MRAIMPVLLAAAFFSAHRRHEIAQDDNGDAGAGISFSGLAQGAARLYRKQGILATSRSKRWNGKKEALSTVFLKDVMQQMIAYGERVQFGQTAIDQKPTYQVINGADKKMAFDGNHHLLHAKEDEFSDASISGILTLEQIRAAIVAGGFRTTTGTRTNRSTTSGPRVSRAATAKASASEAIDAEKYQYFKANASRLPEDIRSHSQEISSLMKAGMTAEQAFNDVLQRYF